MRDGRRQGWAPSVEVSRRLRGFFGFRHAELQVAAEGGRGGARCLAGFARQREQGALR
jgi:hypothetical protein